MYTINMIVDRGINLGATEKKAPGANPLSKCNCGGKKGTKK